jgi:hypothetical protein
MPPNLLTFVKFSGAMAISERQPSEKIGRWLVTLFAGDCMCLVKARGKTQDMQL